MPIRALICIAVAAIALGACDEKPTPPQALGDRNNAVLAGDAAAPATTPAAAPHASAVAAPRKLCSGAPPNTKPPKSIVPTVAAPGATAPPASIPFGVGRWIWVNVWAAWCEPCKAELPRLMAWQERLRAAGAQIDVAFVSIDDDPRQLQRFLEQQPATGLRGTYFLDEGGPRKDFLAALGAKETPELPIQAFFEPNGKLACLVQGGIEDADFPAVATLVGARR